jgi:hypothetical protein
MITEHAMIETDSASLDALQSRSAGTPESTSQNDAKEYQNYGKPVASDRADSIDGSQSIPGVRRYDAASKRA